MKRVVALLVPLALLAGLVAPAGAAQALLASHFGRMFPSLPALNTQTNQQIADLAQTMLDPNVTDPAPGSKDNDGIPSGDTYLGQFIDHDLTLDTSPSPTAPVDPTTLTSGRTFKFDLDSVYCGGPAVTPAIYAADRKHFLVGPNANGVRDLPRNPDGSAILCEHRNDENEIISQVHVGFLMFHNAIMDRLHLNFANTQEVVTNYYQWVVLHDFLPTIVGQDVVDGYLAGCKKTVLGCLPRVYDPDRKKAPMVPVEFSVAAYRFGHSMVRKAYQVNDTTGKLQVFNGTPADLSGGRPLPAGRQIGWDNFFDALAEPNDAEFNHSRNVDTLLSSGLFNLPIPGAEAAGSNVLAFRNMVRAKFYNMPSGQSVAGAYQLPAFSSAQLGLDPAVWGAGTPLWYYILAESDRVNGGKKIGPVGARIIADVFVRVLRVDKDSILKADDDHDDRGDNRGDDHKFSPVPPVAPAPGTFTMADLLVFAGVADRP